MEKANQYDNPLCTTWTPGSTSYLVHVESVDGYNTDVINQCSSAGGSLHAYSIISILLTAPR
eukprot:13768125-Ditylum_brightwellii.AAC.1